MAMTAKATTIRINDDLKNQATRILDTIGLSYNGYVTMATYQLVNQGRIPFEIVPAPEVPNEETRRAMVAAEAKELGLLSDDSPAFTDADELLSYLEA